MMLCQSLPAPKIAAPRNLHLIICKMFLLPRKPVCVFDCKYLCPLCQLKSKTVNLTSNSHVFLILR